MRYVLTIWLLLCITCEGTVSAASESTLEFGPFGKLTVYAPAAEPAHVVLFVSGDGGWNLGVVGMAQALTELDALVVGVDITHYLKVLEQSKQPCAYFAGDLEGLSQYVQKKLGFKDYQRPVLVGYSSGATLVYAALAEAPGGTFAGALSLSFCPDLMLRKPVCRGNALRAHPDARWGQVFDPVEKLDAPWVALHGALDEVCSQAAAERFAGQVKGGELIELPKVGHGYSVQRNWMPQFRAAFQRIRRQAPPEQRLSPVEGLPLEEVPVTMTGNTLAVLVTGDGGWASIDRALANGLAAKGIPVVGWDSLHYLWTARKPDEVGHDLSRVLRHYLDAWQRQRVILIGYSLGADILPVMASRLPPALMDKVNLVALLAPGRSTRLQFHIGDWLGGQADDGIELRPEIDKLGTVPVLCLYGADEASESLCPGLKGEHRQHVALPGGHHFGGDYPSLLKQILDAANGSGH